MRHLVALPVVAALTASGCLSGCSTLGAISQGQTPTVAEVQDDATKICGFVPDASSAASIIISATGSGASTAAAAAGLTLGEFIAKGLCAVVTAKSGVGRVPTAYGVRVRGHFLR